ncbi:MAG: glycosyltransferase family A protein [Actinomycetes bacterium]
MLVSVVVPCFNSLRFLPATLESIAAQTMADLEVVLVDDGGTDDLAGWVRDWSDRCGETRVRVVRQDNAGVSAARNSGVDAAHGEYVAFCDSDDLWEPELLAELLDALRALPGAGLAYSWYDQIEADGTPTGRVIRSEWEGDVWERFVTRNPVAASATLLPRSVFTELGGFEVNRDRFPIDVEDWELWIRVAATYPVAVARRVLAHHRLHDANSSSNVESLEAAYAHLLDRVFTGERPDRVALRPAATARTEVLLAWHSLNDREDPVAALAHRRTAVAHDPGLRRSPEYWRLGAAAGALRLLGASGYRAVRSSARSIRRLGSVVPVHRLRREGTYTP